VKAADTMNCRVLCATVAGAGRTAQREIICGNDAARRLEVTKHLGAWFWLGSRANVMTSVNITGFAGNEMFFYRCGGGGGGLWELLVTRHLIFRWF